MHFVGTNPQSMDLCEVGVRGPRHLVKMADCHTAILRTSWKKVVTFQIQHHYLLFCKCNVHWFLLTLFEDLRSWVGLSTTIPDSAPTHITFSKWYRPPASVLPLPSNYTLPNGRCVLISAALGNTATAEHGRTILCTQL